MSETPSKQFLESVPDGDDRMRLVCQTCGFIDYRNPRLVVGAVSVWEDKILLARRAIHPRKGYWTVPAGFMELSETLAEGAIRETWEEANARIEIVGMLGIYEVPHIGQVHVMHAARMLTPDHAPGVESLETTLVHLSDVPWDELAFPSVAEALKAHSQLDPSQVPVPIQKSLEPMGERKT